MREKKLNNRVLVRLDDSDIEKVDQIALENDRARSSQIRVFVKDGIKKEKK